MGSFLAGAMIVAALFAEPTSPFDTSHAKWKDCGTASGLLSIQACTLFIQSDDVIGVARAVAFYNRGTAYNAIRDYQDAISDFDNAIHFRPVFFEAFTNRGIAFDSLGSVLGASVAFDNLGSLFGNSLHERAIQDFNQAIQLKPDYYLAFVSRGYAYANLGQYQRVVEDYDEALRLQPDNTYALNDRGYSYYRLGQYQRAIQDYDRVLQLNPYFNIAYQNRCSAKASLGVDLDGALADCMKSLEAHPNNLLSLQTRGFVYYLMGNFKASIANEDGAISEFPARAHYIRGLAKLKLGDEAEGNADITAAKSFDPKIVEAYAGEGLKP